MWEDDWFVHIVSPVCHVCDPWSLPFLAHVWSCSTLSYINWCILIICVLPGECSLCNVCAPWRVLLLPYALPDRSSLYHACSLLPSQYHPCSAVYHFILCVCVHASCCPFSVMCVLSDKSPLCHVCASCCPHFTMCALWCPHFVTYVLSSLHHACDSCRVLALSYM